jgi:hypothetical protein
LAERVSVYNKHSKVSQYSPHGLQPSQGRLDWTHWSHACFEVVAREAEAAPFRRLVLTAGICFSLAWHLFTCRASRSLRYVLSKITGKQEGDQILTFGRIGHHNADIYKDDLLCLFKKVNGEKKLSGAG